MTTTHVATRTEQEISYIRDDPRKPGYINIGQIERWLSAAAGGGLLIYGLGRLDLKGLLMGLAGGRLLWRGITGRSYLYKALDISTVEESPSTRKSLPGKGVRVCKSITIERPAQDLYRFWRDAEKAPLYMLNLESVTATNDTHSHWVARTPGGKTIEWDAEITQDQPDHLIAWRISGKSPLGSQGQVRFDPTGNQRGTIVTTAIDFPTFGGSIGSSLGKMLAYAPEQIAHENLRRFKELMEAGEIATIKGQPRGQGKQ